MRNIGELRLDSDDQRYPAIRCFLICLVLLTLGVACRTSDTSRTTTSTSRVSPTGTSMPAPAPTAVLNPTATADLTVTQTASSNTRDDIQLLFGQTAIPEIAGLEITFLGVSEGSRCGEGVNCVIAGQANEDSLLENPFSKPKSESKLTHDLADLWDEYTAYTDRASSVPFQPDNPLMPVIGGKVVIDTSATDAAAASKLLASLESYGLQNGATSGRMVSGYLPMSAINSLNGLNYLNLARPAYASTSVGSVTSQADTAMLADVARTTFGVDGTGITVGTMSDSFDCLSGASGDVGTGDLPSGIVVLDDSECPGTDEGRAMMQLIHDVAPGSSQIFHTAFGGQANFATGINDLVTAGSDIIVDDVGYHAEPMFQDGIIAQAVDTAVAGGVAYFSSSGNLARKAYESQFVDSGEFPLGSSSGPAHDFDLSGGVDAFQSITIPGGVLQYR